MNKNISDADLEVEQLELKSFSRSIAEIEWLLLLLVILYYVIPGTAVDNPEGMVVSMVVFAGFILGFHYVNHDAPQFYWKLALETWAMILFITWVIWNTGSINSPMMNLYIMVIISSAITLGRIVTLLEIALIGAFYFFIAVKDNVTFEINELSETALYFMPFVLVAYITSMLASDLNYRKKLFQLLAETDEMTGLLNKRSFSPLYKKAAEVALKYSEPLSVMMIDADNLKEVNDVYGHQAGDKLIRILAKSIQECLRTSDIICRFGGDEFVALLPQLSAVRAMEAGERLRSAIANTSFDVGGKKIGTTVSIGIASFPDDVKDANSLLDRADEALYEGKRKGRNCVVSAKILMARMPDEDNNTVD